LALTEQGTIFHHQISNTLDGIDEIPLIARDLRDRTHDWLSVVTAAPLANGLVLPTIARIRKSNPNMPCTVHIEGRFENEIIPIEILPVLRAKLTVLMPASHHLAQQSEVRLDQLAAEPIVTLAAGQRWRNRLEDVMGGQVCVR